MSRSDFNTNKQVKEEEDIINEEIKYSVTTTASSFDKSKHDKSNFQQKLSTSTADAAFAIKKSILKHSNNTLSSSNTKKTIDENSRENARALLTSKFDQRIKALSLGHPADHVHDIVFKYEQALYAHFTSNYDKYRNRVKDICLNIIAKDSDTFLLKLIDQQIEPSDLASMNTLDMASDALQRERKSVKARELAALEENALDIQKHAGKFIKKTHKGDEEIQIRVDNDVESFSFMN